MPTPATAPTSIDALTAEVETLLSEIEGKPALLPGHAARILELLRVAGNRGLGLKLTVQRLRERLKILSNRVTAAPTPPSPRRSRYA